jgi:hypothetical protein
MFEKLRKIVTNLDLFILDSIIKECNANNVKEIEFNSKKDYLRILFK